ncbi:polysaccharide biosynthesis C-terminal domain-containing protein [Priestia flexa]|nr:polysaccharide biosynthesis C-terminal domain-containing protein [Priestia flexa]
MPVGKVKGYTVSVIVGAIINFILNIFLIQYYQSVGAAIATVGAELAVTLVQLYWVRKTIEYHKLFQSMWKYLLSGILMFVVLRLIGSLLGVGPLTTILQVISGILIYFILLFILKSQMNKKLFSLGLQKLRKIS